MDSEATTSSASTTFKSIGVCDWLITQCRQMGIGAPTSVQTHCVPQVLQGVDVLGCAKTGTGKTLAFAIPILQTLSTDPYGIYALVITPTRELAFQIGDQFCVLGKPLGVRCSVVTGGRDMVIQGSELHARPHIVVSTPGRLCDHITSAGHNVIALLFSKMKYLVLDEADRLLAGQYSTQLKTIFGMVPKQRQTLLFSATLTDALTQLHQVSVEKPYFYQDHDSDSQLGTVDRLDQRYVLCPVDVKDAYLVYVVKNFIEKNEHSSVLIFTHTCRECQALTGMFQELNFRVGVLHSLIPQRQRLAALAKFRSNRLRILLCTDVAARGLDINAVDLVVSHNVPSVAKTYVHRIGRSARAGRFGNAITFVTQYDITLLHAIEEEIGKKLTELKVNDKNVSTYVAEVLVAKREAEIKLDRDNFGEIREINKRKQMILEGLDPDEVDEAMKKQKNKREQQSAKRVKQTQLRTDRVSKKKVISAEKRLKKKKRKTADS